MSDLGQATVSLCGLNDRWGEHHQVSDAERAERSDACMLVGLRVRDRLGVSGEPGECGLCLVSQSSRPRILHGVATADGAGAPIGPVGEEGELEHRPVGPSDVGLGEESSAAVLSGNSGCLGNDPSILRPGRHPLVAPEADPDGGGVRIRLHVHDPEPSVVGDSARGAF